MSLLRIIAWSAPRVCTLVLFIIVCNKEKLLVVLAIVYGLNFWWGRQFIWCIHIKPYCKDCLNNLPYVLTLQEVETAIVFCGYSSQCRYNRGYFHTKHYMCTYDLILEVVHTLYVPHVVMDLFEGETIWPNYFCTILWVMPMVIIKWCMIIAILPVFLHLMS